MIGWQWNQLDHMQIICTSLLVDSHIHGAKCLPGISSVGELPMGIAYGAKRLVWGDLPHVHGTKRLWANRLWGEMSNAGRIAHEVKHPYMGRNLHGANCPRGVKSIN